MSQIIRNKIAKNVKNCRLNANISREELSLALCFDNSYISKLEHSRINITIDKLEKIANYFNIDIINLLK